MKNILHHGDIYFNKWAGPNNPHRYFILNRIGIASCSAFCLNHNTIEKTMFRTIDLENDIEHFIYVGNVDIDEIIISTLSDLLNSKITQN